MNDVLTRIQQRMPKLSPSERQIAEVVLEHPGLVVNSTITDLAKSCGTSPASIARFARSVDFVGYKDLRLAFAAAESREQAAKELFQVDDADIGPDDAAADLVSKVAYQEMRAIEETARNLDVAALDRVVAMLRDAPRVDVFGAGSSGLTARDLQLKLHRIGISCFAWEDTHLALTSVALAGPGSVVIAISHSGRTVEANEILALARENRAATVAVTNFPDSPLTEHADVTLTTSVRENRHRTGAMSSRTAQMVLIDFLTVRLLQSGFERAERMLRLTYEAVTEHKID